MFCSGELVLGLVASGEVGLFCSGELVLGLVWLGLVPEVEPCGFDWLGVPWEPVPCDPLVFGIEAPLNPLTVIDIPLGGSIWEPLYVKLIVTEPFPAGVNAWIAISVGLIVTVWPLTWIVVKWAFK